MAGFNELPRCPYCGTEMFLCPKWTGYLEFLCPKCKSSSPKCETVSEVWDAAMHRVKLVNCAVETKEIVNAEVVWADESVAADETR